MSKLVKDKKGLTLIECLIALFLEGIIISTIFLFLIPVNSFNSLAQQQSEIQQYGTSVLDFINEQIYKVSYVSIYNLNNSGTSYENTIYTSNGVVFFNDKPTFKIENMDIKLDAEIDNSNVRIYISIGNHNDVIYDNFIDVPIKYLAYINETPEGMEGLIENAIISFGTGESDRYDINSIAYGLRENMRKFAINWTLLTEQERKDKYNGIWYANNTTFRDELRKDKYDGQWPNFPRDKNGNYPDGINSSQNLFVQVYIHTPNNIDNSNADIIIFSNNSQGNNWYTSLIYDHEEAQWYRRLKGGWSCNKTWAEVKEEIHSERWVKVVV